MGLAAKLVTPIVIENPIGDEQSAGSTDYGDVDDDNPSNWDALETTAWIVMLSGTEDETDRETRATLYHVMVRQDVDLRATSRLRFTLRPDEEIEARVLGDPMELVHPRLPYKVARAEAVSG